VVLVDDDTGVLKAISRTLAKDFEVVATVSDGRQALTTVARLDPDIVVLDISMPGLNGFRTAEELKRSGARSKVVFLTMHQDDGFVTEAVAHGAMGYVVKPCAWSDLIPALHHVLAGRKYLPTLVPLVKTNGGGHAVQFRWDDSAWLDEAADVLSGALRRGDTVATVLVASNHAALAARMGERGWNLADLEQQGLYLVFDADETATRIMRAGRLDVDAINAMVATLEAARTGTAVGPRSHLTLLGEIAGVLIRNGHAEAALELERTWDELTRALPILTICTYPQSCFESGASSAFFAGVCAPHSVISHARCA
jgi:CheY-like chemotaxis protein